MTKLCSKCFIIKTEDQFYLLKGAPRNECKSCSSERSKAYAKKHKPWVDNPPTYNPEYQRQWREANKERVAENVRRFKEKNPNYWKEYYRKSLEKPV